MNEKRHLRRTPVLAPPKKKKHPVVSKVTSIGGNTGVIIPRELLEEADMERGDHVVQTVNAKKELIIRKLLIVA